MVDTQANPTSYNEPEVALIMIDSYKAISNAIAEDDVESVERLLADSNLREQLNEGWFDMSRPPLASARRPEMIDLLIGLGADIAQFSEWLAPGFWARSLDENTVQSLIDRGAVISAHAAAALGMVSELEAILDSNPEAADEKGGDGARPLHFARNVETAALLLKRGAHINTIDDDHASPPTHWLLKESPEVVRYLLDQGANLDVFVGVGLEDIDLVKKAVEENPECVNYRIGNNLGPFPGIGFEDTGGSILQWTLGFNCSPHEVAYERNQMEIYQYLMERTHGIPKLLVACMVGDKALAETTLEKNTGSLDQLEGDDATLLARACWETNRNYDAVKIMLELGFPVNVPEFNHGYSPLHNAAFDGNTELVDLLLKYDHPVDEKDSNYGDSPLSWCIHAATVARKGNRDYAGTVSRLLEAGAHFDASRYPVGHSEIDEILSKHLA